MDFSLKSCIIVQKKTREVLLFFVESMGVKFS